MPSPPPPLVARRQALPGFAGAALGAAAVFGLAAWLGRDWLWAALLLAAGGCLGAWLNHGWITRSLTALLADSPTWPAPDGAPTGPLMVSGRGLQPLSAGIRGLVARQQALFAAQADQLEQLRQQAHTDPLTGLANRRHFMAMLDAVLGGGEASADLGLVLLRLHDMQGLNQRIGHAAVDRALQAVAEAVQAYPARIGQCFAGRLNGSDFALLLPVGGMAGETAATLVQALRLPLAAVDAQAQAQAGAVELAGPVAAHQALALADAALARAETDGPAGMAWPDIVLPLVQAGPAPGEPDWQRDIARALAAGQVALAAYPVRTADGRQLHLDCPLRVQLQPGGPMEPAGRWLSLATRSRLCAAVDERAVALALVAIAQDGVARCINVSAQSVESPEFVAEVARQLEAAPQAACRLWIDLPESLAAARPLLVRDVSRRWRPLGAMLGLEHAGEALARLPHLMDLGLDCVRIDSRFVNGITGDGADAARRYLQGLVSLVQAVGLQVSAEGVRSADDLEALWALGFDAATGPALQAEPALTD